MAIGDIAFKAGAESYEELRRSAAYRWQSVNRAGRRPARQYGGIGEEIIELSGTLYPHFTGGLKRMADLRDLAATGKAQILVDGLGNVMGKWTIDRVQETQTVFLEHGQPRKIEFELQLSAYGDDNGGAS